MFSFFHTSGGSYPNLRHIVVMTLHPLVSRQAEHYRWWSCYRFLFKCFTTLRFVLYFILIGPQHPLQPEAWPYWEATSHLRCSEDRADPCWDESPHSINTPTKWWCMTPHKLKVSQQPGIYATSQWECVKSTVPFYSPCLHLPLFNLCNLHG